VSTGRGIHPIDLVVGRNIRALRTAAGISQGHLAKEIGVSFQQVQKYESGANRVSGSRIFEIAEALRSPIEGFYAGLRLPGRTLEESGLAAGVFINQGLRATPDGDDLARAFMRIGSSRRRRTLVALTQAIADENEDTPSRAD